jgi:glycosyltransferase involved in cell wall biosynthesis
VKFSIITVVKNDKDNILKTINSVKNQKFKNFEYIIVDGKSNDGTSKIINDNIKVKKKFKHIVKKDKNLYQALNNGIKIAKGKYILILHSGDIFWNQNILKIVNQSIQDYDAISGNVIYGSKNKFSRYWKYEIENLNKHNCFKIAHTSLVVKKRIINKLKNYNTNYNISSDTDFILRLSSLKNLKFKYIDKTFVIMKTGGLSNSSKNLLSKISQDLKIYQNHFNEKFIFFYLYKLIYKFCKLITWKFSK